MLKEIVITGGSCGGKSSAVKYIRWNLERRGYKVFVVPEVATDFMEMGYDLANGPSSKRIQQMNILHEYRHRRRLVKFWAEDYKRVVILYDRYVMDSAAFYDANFDTLLRDSNFDWMESSQFPDAVIHMVSPAVDHPAAYNQSNNKHRYLNIADAAIEDRKIQEAWLSHGHLRIVPNEGSFSDKLVKAMNHVSHALNSIEIERKFRVEFVHPIPSRVPMATKVIEQVYLDQVRYSRATFKGQCTYQWAQKTGEGHVRTEKEQWMTKEDWESISATEGVKKLTKTRDNFLWNNRFYELDSIPGRGLVLEIEQTSPNEEYQIPPFLRVIEEVTEVSAWKSKNLAVAV